MSDLPQPAKDKDADQVWTVSVTKALAENVNFRLLYGQRQVDNVILAAGMTGKDIKVLRGELTVTF